MEFSHHAHLASMFTKLTTAVLLGILTACTIPKTESKASNPANLQGEWNLVSVYPDTTDLKKGIIDKWPYLSIDTAKKTIGGYSGCNSFGGGFTLTKDKISVGDVMATQRGCIGSVEPVLFKYLPRITRFTASKDSLKLYAMDTLLLSFARKPGQLK
jgi:heat shock protein HslJ